jgi:hypothetical protein
MVNAEAHKEPNAPGRSGIYVRQQTGYRAFIPAGQSRNRRFRYAPYIRLFNEDREGDQ